MKPVVPGREISTARPYFCAKNYCLCTTLCAPTFLLLYIRLIVRMRLPGKCQDSILYG